MSKFSKRLLRAAASAALLFGVTTFSLTLQADTASQIVDGSSPEALVNIIQDMGYRAALETDSEGDPMIRSSVGGTQFALVFYGCNDDHRDCQIVLFKAGYELNDKVGLDVINQWNATRLFGRAYLDEVSDPWIELVLNMQGGVTRSQFERTFEWWETSVGEFEDEIGV